MKEMIAEMPITEWEGARIKVSIELPQLRNSLTTQRYIDHRELDELKALEPNKDLYLLLDTKPELARFEMMRWESQNRKAKKLLDMISNQISWQLGKAIGEALGENG